jgi:hypothetical protein
MFLINSLVFNAIYSTFQWFNYSLSDGNLCETIGVFMHFFFISTFGLVLAITIMRLVKLFTIIQDSVKFTLLALVLVYGK